MTSENKGNSGKTAAAERFAAELNKLKATLDSSLIEVDSLAREAQKYEGAAGKVLELFARALNSKQETPSFGAKINQVVGRLSELKESLGTELKHTQRTYRNFEQSTANLLDEKSMLEKEIDLLSADYKKAAEENSKLEGKGARNVEEARGKLASDKKLEKARNAFEEAQTKLGTINMTLELDSHYGPILKHVMDKGDSMATELSNALRKLDIIYSTIMRMAKFTEANEKILAGKPKDIEGKQTLDAIVDDCKIFIKLPLNTLDHLYKAAERRVAKINYSKEDLDQFFDKLDKFEHFETAQFNKRAGVYFSALIKKVAKPGDKFTINVKKIMSNYFLLAVDWVGCMLEEATIELIGIAGQGLGAKAKNCTIYVDGPVLNTIGEGAAGTFIVARGKVPLPPSGVGDLKVVTLMQDPVFHTMFDYQKDYKGYYHDGSKVDDDTMTRINKVYREFNRMSYDGKR